MSQTDNIYSKPLTQVDGFTFDEQVVQVFPDMIKRSVPGYEKIIHMIAMITERCAVENSNLYDLGCSLGAATLSMRRGLNNKKGCQIIAVDNSAAMVERCQQYIHAYKSDTAVAVLCDDICNIQIENASVVVLNFTLQFLTPEKRLTLLTNIYNGLLPGGVLVLSEKFLFDDSVSHQLLIDLHLDFKRSQGYSELEISQKRSSLENVLISDTLEAHFARLKTAGFSHNNLCYQCFNFGSIISIK
ncbi:carboxy-S-adenosyl-L-methionine synthase CmoA [Psychromonas antarctica]|jgi:tRNA (cmo5U34)-methyltransferase|uniref:carboxy-S-adenosyl-L-methionine synthase CmoA n=1 Tax=Psychromonas antarctica TaxID=67573 RepID=UPI001EE87B2C|nr:carboxy-S-adenosyl-L-methionine synthase CmoA [Psychromonas antarctica]MCG6201381.1 carboxy-S-adenosyl-L-methionine synthase CmoA [Psychromonas antarctica]